MVHTRPHGIYAHTDAVFLTRGEHKNEQEMYLEVWVNSQQFLFTPNERKKRNYIYVIV
jgi:hypothetical protein